MDALSLIHNHVLSTQLGLPENWVASLAPVKSSFVWNIPQSAWAQWSGVLNLPIRRNLGEVLGIFAKMDLTSKTSVLKDCLLPQLTCLGKSSPRISCGVLRLRHGRRRSSAGSTERRRRRATQTFREPTAPDVTRLGHTGGANPRSRASGSSRMLSFPRAWSAQTRCNSAGRNFRPTPERQWLVRSAYSWSRRTQAPTLAPPRAVFEAIQQGIFERAVADLKLSDEELISAHGYRAFPPEPVEPAPSLSSYKANPAEGMWSSPPFLHNGSVPNLYELLLPAAQSVEASSSSGGSSIR